MPLLYRFITTYLIIHFASTSLSFSIYLSIYLYINVSKFPSIYQCIEISIYLCISYLRPCQFIHPICPVFLYQSVTSSSSMVSLFLFRLLFIDLFRYEPLTIISPLPPPPPPPRPPLPPNFSNSISSHTHFPALPQASPVQDNRKISHPLSDSPLLE